jgi:hypothetical protein
VFSLVVTFGHHRQRVPTPLSARVPTEDWMSDMRLWVSLREHRS